MKSYMWLGALAALVVADSFVVAGDAAAQGMTESNGPDVTHAARAAVPLAQATRAIPFKTAAIQSNGTLASCFRCVSAASLGGGAYQVIFDENVQATNGWSRWVQVDTLSTGSISNISCTTADRAGNVNGVFVLCSANNTGVSTPTSFFLIVAR
jgi:hypothetical protein